MSYKDLLVTVEEVADAFRYDESEYPYIEHLILSAQTYLYNAGSFDPDNPMTVNAIFAFCGEALENRDGMGYDYKNTQHLHSSMTSLINSLRFMPPETVDEQVGDVDATNG